METVSNNSGLNKILDLFQSYQKNGQCSRLVLETMGGDLTAHLSVQWPNSPAPGWTSRSTRTETKPARRMTPSRRRRNQARREQWLARNISKTKVNVNNDEKKQDDSVSSEKEIGTVKNVSENPRQLVCSVKNSVTTQETETDVIDQIDGNIESTVTYDLTISAATSFEAFCSIEENLCRGDDGDKIPFISEVASKEVKDENNEQNTLYTLEIKIDNETLFIAKVEETFRNWETLYYGKPRGTLVSFEKRK